MKNLASPILFCCLFARSFLGLPVNPIIEQGQATCSHLDDRLTIVASDDTTISWSVFSIDETESVQFILPSINSLALNRVREANPSYLMGRLESNGHVLLINPHGILVGKDAVLDLGSFTASAFDSLDMNRNAPFSEESMKGVIRIDGIVHTKESVTLEGQGIALLGNIFARGSIDLQIRAERSDPETASPPNYFASAEVYSGQILSKGIIEGKSVTAAGHFIDLLGGRLSADRLDIGKGSNRTWVSENTILEGQEVFILSEMATHCYGKIVSNKGYAEVSSLGFLDFRGSLDLNGGTFLLDPTDIEIADFGGASMPAFTSPTYSPVAVSAQLDLGQLNADLGTGVQYIIQTNILGGGSGNVTVNSMNDPAFGIIISSDSSLTINADNDLLVNGSIIATAPFSMAGPQIALNAGNNLFVGYAGQGHPIEISTVDGSIEFLGTNGITIGDTGIGASITIAPTGAMSFTSSGPLSTIGSDLGGDVIVGTIPQATSIDIQANSFVIQNGLGGTAATLWQASGPVQIDCDTTFQILGGFSGTSTNFLTNGSLTLDAGAILIQGGTNANNSALLSSSGPQLIRTLGLIRLEGGIENTTHASIACLSGTQTIECAGLELIGGQDISEPPNSNAIIESLSGDQFITVADTIFLEAGNGNTTDARLDCTNGNQTIECSALQMQGGDSSFGNCRAEIRHNTPSFIQRVEVLGNISLVAGSNPTTNGAWARIDSQCEQIIIADSISIFGGPVLGSVNVSSGFTTQDNQTVEANGQILMQGIAEEAFILSLLDQTITANEIILNGVSRIQCDGSLQQLDVTGDLTLSGTLASGPSIVASNQQSLSIGGDLNMIADSNNVLLHCFGNGPIAQMDIAGEWLITTSGGFVDVFQGGSPYMTNVGQDIFIDPSGGGSINIGGTEASWSANGVLEVNTPLSLGQAYFNQDVFSCTIQGDISLFGGSGPNAFTQMEIEDSFDLSTFGNFSMIGGDGDSSFVVVGTDVGGTLSRVSVRNDLLIQGGGGLGAFSGFSLISAFDARAANDINLIGGSGTNSSAFISTIPLTGGPSNIIAGNNIVLNGGDALGGDAYSSIINLEGVLNVSSGGSIQLIAGTNAPSNHAAIGGTWSDLTLIGFPAIDDIVSTSLAAAANISCVNNPSGSVATFDLFSHPNIVNPLIGPFLPPSNNNGSMFIYAAGDIDLTDSFVGGEAIPPYDLTIHPFEVVANRGFVQGDLWPGSAAPALNGTILQNPSPILPNDFLGGISIDGALSFSTERGLLHLSSFPEFAAGGVANLTVGPNSGEVTLTSISGNIIVDPFFNIMITNTISTAGNILIIAQNDIHMTSTSSIASGASTTLVVDNQAPTMPLIGSGAFIMDLGSSILTGAELRIFTAIRQQNTISGLLNTQNFQEGPIYSNSVTEQWGIYFPSAINGIPYTIFYKDFIQQAITQSEIIISEELTELTDTSIHHGWEQEFSLQDEIYYLRRPMLRVLNQPKSYTDL